MLRVMDIELSASRDLLECMLTDQLRVDALSLIPVSGGQQPHGGTEVQYILTYTTGRNDAGSICRMSSKGKSLGNASDKDTN